MQLLSDYIKLPFESAHFKKSKKNQFVDSYQATLYSSIKIAELLAKWKVP